MKNSSHGIRILPLLLIPCLVADPTLAAVPSAPGTSCGTKRLELFSQEALSARATFPFRSNRMRWLGTAQTVLVLALLTPTFRSPGRLFAQNSAPAPIKAESPRIPPKNGWEDTLETLTTWLNGNNLQNRLQDPKTSDAALSEAIDAYTPDYLDKIKNAAIALELAGHPEHARRLLDRLKRIAENPFEMPNATWKEILRIAHDGVSKDGSGIPPIADFKDAAVTGLVAILNTSGAELDPLRRSALQGLQNSGGNSSSLAGLGRTLLARSLLIEALQTENGALLTAVLIQQAPWSDEDMDATFLQGLQETALRGWLKAQALESAAAKSKTKPTSAHALAEETEAAFAEVAGSDAGTRLLIRMLLDPKAMEAQVNRTLFALMDYGDPGTMEDEPAIRPYLEKMARSGGPRTEQARRILERIQTHKTIMNWVWGTSIGVVLLTALFGRWWRRSHRYSTGMMWIIPFLFLSHMSGRSARAALISHESLPRSIKTIALSAA